MRPTNIGAHENVPNLPAWRLNTLIWEVRLALGDARENADGRCCVAPVLALLMALDGEEYDSDVVAGLVVDAVKKHGKKALKRISDEVERSLEESLQDRLNKGETFEHLGDHQEESSQP